MINKFFMGILNFGINVFNTRKYNFKNIYVNQFY